MSWPAPSRFKPIFKTRLDFSTGALGVGALVGLLLALGIGGLFDGPYTVHRGNIGKGIFACLFTMLVAFLLWIIIAEFLHNSPILWPPLPSLTLTLNSWWATIWLLYYVGMHGIYALSASGQSVTMRGQCLYRYQLVSLSSPNTAASNVPQEQRLVLTDRDATMVPAFDTTTPLSRAHPGGPKWGHIENCYEQYRKSLTRFHPVPFDLRTPDGFRYYDDGGQQIYWYKHTLLLPKVFLDPQWRHALLPELARLLMYYNAPDLRVFELLNSYPRDASETFFFLATLNFLWLPTIVKNVAGERWQSERVLDGDVYAYKLGEGMRLRARLRAEQEAIRRDGLTDSTFPTLDERIEQLNAFIGEEAQQLRALGYTGETAPKTAQYVIATPQLVATLMCDQTDDSGKDRNTKS